MSLTLVQETAKEVRRLAIAGSGLAVGDFRLKKLAAPLEQAGAKVPVFAQVAKAIQDLVDGREAESALHLLNLSTLVNAILYTQGATSPGTTGQPGAALEEFPVSPSTGHTRSTSRLLKPVVEALTTTGSGRFEIVKSAFARGAFSDLRLIEPSIRALDDVYPELADLVAEKILPAYGPGIAPLVQSGLNLKGKRSDGRRLELLHRFNPQGAIELCKAALESGSAEVKESAITCLGQHPECLTHILDQASSRNKTLRVAALVALAPHDQPEITALFLGLLQGKSLDGLTRPFRIVRNPEVLAALLAEGRRVHQLLLKGEEDSIPRALDLLDCLIERREPSVEEFLLACFAQSDKLAKLKAPKNSTSSGADLVARLAETLSSIGSAPAMDAILKRRDTLPIATFGLVVRAALKSWPPARVFEEFSPLLKAQKGANRQKSEELQRYLMAAHWNDDSRFAYAFVPFDPLEKAEERPFSSIPWDARWLDAAIDANQRATVCVLARPGHRAVVDYLVAQADAKTQSEDGLIVRALVRCQYPKVTDVFLKLFSRRAKSARFVDYELQFLLESVRQLPPADLPKLDAFAGTLEEKFVDAFLEAIGPLRSPAPAEATGSDEDSASRPT